MAGDLTAVFIQKDSQRYGAIVSKRAHGVIVGHKLRPLHTGRLGELLHLFRASPFLDGQADNLHAALAVFVVQPNQSRYFSTAWRTPGAPEIYYHRFLTNPVSQPV